MKPDLSRVLALLARIQEGGDVSFEQVQKLEWHVGSDLDPFIQRIYRQLQMFASDKDIRTKDHQYDQSWRKGIASLFEELKERADIR